MCNLDLKTVDTSVKRRGLFWGRASGKGEGRRRVRE
jgi:hypothetical protein